MSDRGNDPLARLEAYVDQFAWPMPGTISGAASWVTRTDALAAVVEVREQLRQALLSGGGVDGDAAARGQGVTGVTPAESSGAGQESGVEAESDRLSRAEGALRVIENSVYGRRDPLSVGIYTTICDVLGPPEVTGDA